MNAEILLITGAVLIYMVFGIFFTRYLKDCWYQFGQLADSSPVVHFTTILAWAPLFLVLITWRVLEPIMEDRRSDWE